MRRFLINILAAIGALTILSVVVGVAVRELAGGRTGVVLGIDGKPLAPRSGVPRPRRFGHRALRNRQCRCVYAPSRSARNPPRQLVDLRTRSHSNDGQPRREPARASDTMGWRYPPSQACRRVTVAVSVPVTRTCK